MESKKEAAEDSSDSEYDFEFRISDGEYKAALENIRAHEEAEFGVRSASHKVVPSKDFVCEVCGKNLKSAGSLVKHKLIHTGIREFSCDRCPKTFTQKVGLEKHEQIHRGQYNFSCKVCQKKFRQKQSLQHHLAHRHRIGLFHHFCPTCNKGFADKGSMLIHLLVHIEDTFFECSICSQKFKHKSSLVRHGKTHFKATTCTLCPVPKTFRYESFLQKHLKLMHNVELACIENEEPQMAIEERPPEHQLKSAENQQVLMIQEQHPIQIVQVINDQQQIFMEIMEQPKIEDIPIYLQSYETVQGEFLVFDGLVEEVTYQTEKEIPKASKEEIVEEIREDLKISEKDLKNPALEFQCHLCYKQFSRKYYLNRHVKNHDKKPSTICYICGKTLKSPINLHMKAVHENVRPFRCDICNKTFREKNRLRLHMMVHTDIAPHKCDICSKTFRHLQNFKNHIYKHSGVKRFVCPVCNRGFVENGSLKSHMVVHQPEKKFQCQTCLKLIRRKISYEKHIKNCKGALITYCLECKKNFRYESFLKTHIVNLHPNLTSNPYYHKLFSSDVK